MEIFNKGLLSKAIEEINFIEVFGQINPHAQDANKQLEKLLSIKVNSLRNALLQKCAGINEETIFQNMIAVAYDDPLLLMAVWRAFLNSTKINKSHEDEINRIKTSICKSNLSKTGLKTLIKGKFTEIPTIEVIEGITPALNFRYWLATQNLSEINTIDLIRFPQITKKISRLAWQREVNNLIANKVDRKLCNRIDKNSYDNLSISEKMMLVSDINLFTKLTIEIDNREKELENLNAILKNQNQLVLILFSIIRCIQRRELYKASELLESIKIIHYQGELVSRFKPILRKKIAEYVYPKVKSWEHLNTKSLIKLQKLCESKKLVTYFGASAKNISNLLIEKKLQISEIHPKDLSLLRLTWTEVEKNNLIKGGIYDALTYIPDKVAIKLLPQLLENANSKEPSKLVVDKISSLIRSGDYFDDLLPFLIEGKYPVLIGLFKSCGSYYRNKYSQKLIKYFGSSNDVSCIDHSSTEDAKDLIAYLNKSDVIEPLAYNTCLAGILTKNLLHYLSQLRPYATEQRYRFREWAELAFTYTELCNEGGKYLAKSLSSDQTAALLNETSFPNNLWGTIIDHVQDEQFRLSLRAKNFHRMNAGEFLNNLKLHPYLINYVGIKNKKPFKEFEDDLDKIATIICVRRSPKNLKKLQEFWTKSDFKNAATAACEYLPPRSRQRGYLSLISHLDKSVTLPLAAIMSTSKRDAKPGNKLNHLYSSFEIPKKNGKKRTITAPSPILKKVQKSVLTNLINGVRVHPAANGFRLGKSIITNAFPHTNKKILANCDVANCFPSISWPLIYKALKNSLENHVGIEAVSILTDICSKEGSLPMGAPTSPALLNIVLYKTDEVLFKAASNLNCSYTRYADDLTFSGDDKAIKLIGLAGVSLNKIGLKIDPVKTNIFRRGRRQSVTGLVVNDGISVNRKYRKSVRAAAHRIEHDQEPTWHGKPVTKSSIQGRIDFINSVHKKTNAKKD